MCIVLLLKELKEILMCVFVIFFFQAEDGIRDAQESRGLGDVYKRQVHILCSTSLGVFLYDLDTLFNIFFDSL